METQTKESVVKAQRKAAKAQRKAARRQRSAAGVDVREPGAESEDERMVILSLLEKGKISVEEAEALLSALES